MTKQKSIPEYVTREILKEEISASEKRFTATLDSKIESTSQSLKDYTDSRFNHLDTTIKTMDAKMTRYFEGFGTMLEGLTGKSAATQERLDNHEQRIVALEGRGPQPGRI
jgi:hypothetical protein